MSKFSLNIPDDVELRFRRAAQEKYGMKKGNLTLALIDALNDFSEKMEKKQKSR